jgi:Na+-driven multidrug efflux pump
MVLAPFLIFGWGTNVPLGVAGAALSSLIAVAVGILWLGSYFRSSEQYLYFRRTHWKPNLGVWGGMLKIGLPAGAEFALTAVYLFVVYRITRPFGSSAQAGFGIGLRLIQSLFMPVVALGFSVGPVAGQNVGAHKADRVRAAFRSATGMAVSVMAAMTVLCNLAADRLFDIFTNDPEVIRIGVEYLRIVSWSFVASGVVFVSSSLFQALGNTIPPLITSFARILVVAIPVIALSMMPGFQLKTIWYLSASGVALQMMANLLLLRREFALRLAFPAPDHPSLSA